MTKHEVFYGGLGSGKSTYASNQIDPQRTFKLGIGGLLKDTLIFKFGSKKRHEDEDRKRGIEFKTTDIRSITKDILCIKHPTLLIDEWTSLFLYSFWWPSEKIITRANKILNVVEENSNIENGIYIALDYVPYMPFNLYKKEALWNKLLFERADEITRIDYGKPIKIFQKQDTKVL